MAPLAAVTMKVDSSGAFSGKVAASLHDGIVASGSFKGVLSTGEGDPPGAFSGSVRVRMKGWTTAEAPVLAFEVTQGGVTGGISATINGTDNSIQFSGSHSSWSKANPVDKAARGRFPFGLSASDALNYDSSNLGYGFGRAVVSANGKLALSGTLGDGTRITSSALLCKSLFPLDTNLYASNVIWLYSGRGAATCALTVVPGTTGPDFFDAGIEGGFDWLRNGSGYRGAKSFPFTFTRRASLLGGGKYLAPDHPSGLTGPLMLNTDEIPDNVTFTFPFFGPASIVTRTLTRSNQLSSIDPPDVPSLKIRSIRFHASKGEFSGTGRITASTPSSDSPDAIFPSQPFQVTGLVVRDRNSLKSVAVGQFRLLEIMDDPNTGEIVERYRLNRSIPIGIDPIP